MPPFPICVRATARAVRCALAGALILPTLALAEPTAATQTDSATDLDSVEVRVTALPQKAAATKFPCRSCVSCDRDNASGRATHHTPRHTGRGSRRSYP